MKINKNNSRIYPRGIEYFLDSLGLQVKTDNKNFVEFSFSNGWHTVELKEEDVLELIGQLTLWGAIRIED